MGRKMRKGHLPINTHAMGDHKKPSTNCPASANAKPARALSTVIHTVIETIVQDQAGNALHPNTWKQPIRGVSTPIGRLKH